MSVKRKKDPRATGQEAPMVITGRMVAPLVRQIMTLRGIASPTLDDVFMSYSRALALLACDGRLEGSRGHTGARRSDDVRNHS